MFYILNHKVSLLNIELTIVNCFKFCELTKMFQLLHKEIFNLPHLKLFNLFFNLDQHNIFFVLIDFVFYLIKYFYNFYIDFCNNLVLETDYKLKVIKFVSYE